MKLKGIKQFGKELSAIGRNKKLLIPIIGVLTIPVMYSSMFLGAFWDPYGNLEKLPVAVVNSDEGTVFQDEQMHIGQDFVEQLKEEPKFDWAFVTEEEAMQGMKDNKYYMAIEIPEDFSEKTASLTSDQPERAKLVFLPNKSSNFLASQIGSNAVEQMKSLLNQEVTEAYTRTVFDKLESAADGIVQASDGAGEIADGAAKAKDGADLLEQNLRKLASGTVSLQEGVTKLNDAGKQLQSGSAELQAGAETLAGGMGQLADASSQLAQGASSAKEGASSLTDGLTASAAGAAELKDGAASLSAGLQGLAAKNPALAEDPNFQALVEASKGLAIGMEQSAAGQEQLLAGAAELKSGLEGLSAGAGTFNTKLEEAKTGAESLTEGITKLAGGSSELSSGLGKLKASVDSMTSGTKQLKDGATEMASGLTKLQDGSLELSTKLSDASSESSDLSLTDDMVSMFAEPIELDVDPITDVPNYGTGLAPYFLSLGLYVGAMLLTIVYSVKEPAVRPANGWSWFWSKALTLMAIGTIQALIADAALLYILKLNVQNIPLFIMFSIATSITYMMIIHFLVATMGNPGRFIAVIILILQLTSSSGTFPGELTPGWLQHVSPWLPMTYSVAGLRDVISSGELSRMWNDVGLLAVYAAAFAVLSLTYFIISHRKGRGESNDDMAAV
ncbi:YhgE/Pip domain-containing protein [Paenibacillus nanensis]|uniref:YhgE/Pip domain-containing protein n=1 Tax=Paenibacillus nanensis TaxID=393251 RepID=A0A3A1VKE6_9BACL|nr:YhgE/Pip domain-containing protein [Paenibacillus nanensis]RIX60212.1 YhgE/Pip domain-containing protein [Paenibacillus nanensis]